MFSLETNFIVSIVVFSVWFLLTFVNYFTDFKGKQSTPSQKFWFIILSTMLLCHMAINVVQNYLLLNK